MKKKKLIFTMVCILVIVILIFIIIKSINNKGDGKNSSLKDTIQQNNEEKYVTIIEKEDVLEKHNNSEDLKRTKNYNNLEISNIQFTSNGSISNLIADVKNIGQKKHIKETVQISILDENNQVLATLQTEISDIEPGETKKMHIVVTADIVNAKDFTVKSK